VASVAAAYAGADEEKLNAYRAETAVSEADMHAELAAAAADFAAGNTASGDEVRRRYGLS
jgi:roadblock/LC7 domain-containing protein